MASIVISIFLIVLFPPSSSDAASGSLVEGLLVSADAVDEEGVESGTGSLFHVGWVPSISTKESELVWAAPPLAVDELSCLLLLDRLVFDGRGVGV